MTPTEYRSKKGPSKNPRGQAYAAAQSQIAISPVRDAKKKTRRMAPFTSQSRRNNQQGRAQGCDVGRSRLEEVRALAESNHIEKPKDPAAVRTAREIRESNRRQAFRGGTFLIRNQPTQAITALDKGSTYPAK